MRGILDGTTIPYGSPITYPTQYLNITMYGDTSGKKTGQITLTNQSYTIQGITFSGMLQTSNVSVGGDSGAPVWADAPVGMIVGATLSNGNWVPGSSFSVCSVLENLTRRYSTYDIYLSTF